MQRRRSKKREQILSVLKKSKGALSASEIHKKVPGVDLVTVYRNLEMFVEDGLVKKLSLDKGEAVFEYMEDNHHHAICTDCEKVIHFEASDQEIMKLIQIKDFVPESLELTVRGKCGHK